MKVTHWINWKSVHRMSTILSVHLQEHVFLFGDCSSLIAVFNHFFFKYKNTFKKTLSVSLTVAIQISLLILLADLGSSSL